jgi:hypothetical protein
MSSLRETHGIGPKSYMKFTAAEMALERDRAGEIKIALPRKVMENHR